MKQGPVYTIVFILILTAVFTAALATADAFFAPTIEANRALAERRDVLYALGLDATGDAAALNARFEASVTERTAGDGTTFYVQRGTDGNDVAYAVPFTGSGLWGTIRGFLAVTANADRIVGIVFTEQQETPGLGGRIDEPAFKEQFRGVAISPATKIAYGLNGDKEIDAVTGATITSNAVMRILNDTLADVFPKLLEVMP